VGHTWGGGTAGGRHGGCGLLLRPPVLYFHLLFCCYVSSVREVENSMKEKTKFPNLKIFGEKNKRQFMKLVKIIFVQERNNPNYN
jgi:hypothetical protein